MASAVRTRRAAHRLVTKASVLQEVDENAQEPEEHEREQQLGDFLEEMDMEGAARSPQVPAQGVEIPVMRLVGGAGGADGAPGRCAGAVDMRCRSMYALADQVALTMRNRLRVEIMKIPRNIRSMTAKDFEKEFGCSIEDVLTNPDAVAAAATSTAATATCVLPRPHFPASQPSVPPFDARAAACSVRKPSKRPPTRAPATTAKVRGPRAPQPTLARPCELTALLFTRQRARGAATAGTSGVAATPAGRRPRRGDQPPATVVKTRSGKEVSVFQVRLPRRLVGAWRRLTPACAASGADD